MPTRTASTSAVGRTIVRIGSIGVRTGQIAVIVTLLALLAAIWAFFRYSKIGVAMRAVAADDRTALLMGISATRVHALAWAASSVIAGNRRRVLCAVL